MKKWERALKGELIFLVIFLIATSFLLLLPRMKHAKYPNQVFADVIIIIFCAIIGIIALVLYLLRQRSRRIEKISRWLNIITVPFALSITWIALSVIASTRLPKFQIISEIIMGLIYLVVYLPVVIVDYSAIKNWLGRIIATVLLFMAILSGSGTKFSGIIGTMFNSGFISAITGFIVAIILAKRWGFSGNPNIKAAASSNFSWLTCFFLLLFTAMFVFWNVYCGNGNNLFSVLFKVDWEPFKPTWTSLFSALEAGILEESVRYLTILALLARFASSNKRIEWTILLSAVVFGLMHLSNFGWQKLDATISQVTYAWAFGLVLAAVYLYTGQLWLPMIFHFLNDFLVMSQPGGMGPGTWSGSINDWLSLLVSVVLPAAITVWMLFGRRKQTMLDNSEKLLNKNL